MPAMIIEPARRVSGEIRLPGDKSISHRAAMLAAIADGTTTITNFLTGADCLSTLACLQQLGAEIERDGATARVHGRGRLHAPAAPLDCGNSGSTMRMLAGLLAARDFTCELTGDESLRSRPMKRIIAPLEQMGATVASQDGYAPLRVTGRAPLKAISYETPVASAQVKSCVLLAGLGAAGQTVVTEKTLTRDHTERMLRWFGVEVEETQTDEHTVALRGPASLRARDVSVPGDVSSAAFFLVAAALRPGSEIVLRDVGLNPTRAQIVPVLQGLGVEIAVEELREDANEPVGALRARGRESLAPATPQANRLSGATVAQMIDELPALAVLGTQIEGGLTVRQAAELRVKESDRIASVVSNLRAMGAEVEEYPDGFAVNGPTKLKGATIESYGDHRIAMAFSVAALIAGGRTEIRGAECASVSFPEFYQLLTAISQR
jgi:3-phosphoshikimate 1-carboxyvinyltransferase